jgi:hypothetical protein
VRNIVVHEFVGVGSLLGKFLTMALIGPRFIILHGCCKCSIILSRIWNRSAIGSSQEPGIDNSKRGVIMQTNALELGEAYIRALSEKNLEKIEGYVDPALRFKSPVMESSTAKNFLKAVQRLLANMKSMRVKSKFSSENRAIFTYEMDFGPPIGIVRSANLMTIEGDKIKEMELFFDARPFDEKAGPSSSKQ